MTEEELDNKLERLDEKVNAIQVSVAKLCGAAEIAPLLIKWLCFPLITILGVVYGIKVVGGV